MLSVQMLKPFYVKQEVDRIRIMLAYQYFSIHIDDKLYHFVPVEGREISINRDTKQIENTKDVLVFQNGKHMIQISILELMDLPDFLTHVNSIAHRYLKKKKPVNLTKVDRVIHELEMQNAKRLIDEALDKRETKKFHDLVWYIKDNF
ncbi:hypothetical protein [Pontibacillus marinus]|uniref:IDEAL domain-containing protein n=1 Tax=Pontibacillus marinus BH030004 = DSM 16465 TaxID=1385511 RepID=A0A0A5GHH2_9BACI|nr:hypothetical protein [Pontibacillus marinus]KGX90673.1 hypothetical protein N783_20145 [Pontibacillus marinus BH030004 = DSM 16465]